VSDTGPDAVFVVVALICVPAGAYLGGSFGQAELGLLGLIVGGIAGGFFGLLFTYVLGLALVLGFFAVVILGPLALILVGAYYLYRNVAAH